MHLSNKHPQALSSLIAFSPLALLSCTEICSGATACRTSTTSCATWQTWSASTPTKARTTCTRSSSAGGNVGIKAVPKYLCCAVVCRERSVRRIPQTLTLSCLFPRSRESLRTSSRTAKPGCLLRRTHTSVNVCRDLASKVCRRSGMCIGRRQQITLRQLQEYSQWSAGLFENKPEITMCKHLPIPRPG